MGAWAMTVPGQQSGEFTDTRAISPSVSILAYAEVLELPKLECHTIDVRVYTQNMTFQHTAGRLAQNLFKTCFTSLHENLTALCLLAAFVFLK